MPDNSVDIRRSKIVALTTVRVNDNVPGPLTPPQRHLQGIAGQLRRHAWRH